MWHISDEEGLPSMTIYNLLQDSRGFMWFGTEAGVCRFDGRNFKVYPAPSAKYRSGTSLTEDKFGNIWFRNFAKQLFKIEKEHVVEIELPKEIRNVNAYLLNEQDGLLVVDWNVAYIAHIQNLAWRKIPTPITEICWGVYTDKACHFHLLTVNGVMRYEKEQFILFDEQDKAKRFLKRKKNLYV